MSHILFLLLCVFLTISLSSGSSYWVGDGSAAFADSTDCLSTAGALATACETGGPNATCAESTATNIAGCRCCATPASYCDFNCQTMTYDDCETRCISNGHRLCTVEELLNEDSADTGCFYNLMYVWSSSDCTPTGEPSSEPTSQPTTSLPSSVPTVEPTSQPSLRVCHYDFLLVDLFGDGWVNTWLNVTRTHEEEPGTFLLQTNCSYSVMTVVSAKCSIDVSTVFLDDNAGVNDTAVAPWEIYWQLVDDEGTRYVGDSNSELRINDDKFVYFKNPVNITVANNSCQDCIVPSSQPKPKPKPPPIEETPKPKPKPTHKKRLKKPPPPYDVVINLFDEEGDGFFDGSGEFDAMGIPPNLYNTSYGFPNVLVYPKYYIMTKDRQELITSGTFCSSGKFESCQEMIPDDGEYVFRFAGLDTLSEDEATWSFCRRTGGINEEFEFQIHYGQCFPTTETASSDTYCQLGFDSIVELSMTFDLMGMFGEDILSTLSEQDTVLLAKEVSSLFPVETITTVTSVEHPNASSFTVQLKVAVMAEQLGYLGHYSSEVDSMMSVLSHMVQNQLESGSLLEALLNGVEVNENDLLKSTEKVSLLDVSLISVHYENPKNGLVNSKAVPIEEHLHHRESVLESVVRSEFIIGGLFALFGVMAAIYVNAPPQTLYSPLSSDTPVSWERNSF